MKDNQYANIIHLEHFHAPGRPYMSMRQRAAQFAPYKSLVGYEEMIDEKTDAVLKYDDHVIEYDDEYLAND